MDVRDAGVADYDVAIEPGQADDDVPPGYKRTEVGVVPCDWDLRLLADLSAFITKGATPTTYGFRWQSSGVLFLRSECVSEHGLDLKQAMFISADGALAIRRSTIRSGDLLMTITGNVGRVVVYGLKSEAGINQHIARIRIVVPDADRHYVFHWLSQPFVRFAYNSITTGQAYPQISLKQVRETFIAVPRNQREQQAIAEALSDADALIDSLQQLIAKERALKQGAMQALLTGRQRLPGFTGEWQTIQLGKVLKFQVGCPFSSIYFNQAGEGLRLVRNRDLKADDQVIHFSGSYDSSYLVANGDVLIGMDGDFVTCRWQKGRALLNQRVGRVLPKSALDKTFAFYCLADPLRVIEDQTSSTTVKHLSHSDVESIEMCLPGIEEQTAIAAILSDMDAKIEALEARLAKTRALKAGMMQQLLTGRIRLV